MTSTATIATAKSTDCTATAEWKFGRFWVWRGQLPLEPPAPGSFWFELVAFSQRLERDGTAPWSLA
ncbi:MAG: hypothetical protein HQ527_07785 [Cyanobacteria bacterium]|nr:hypothetical protein [Cyanobacteria bacterium bin.51]